MSIHLLRITNEYPQLVNEVLDQIPETFWKSKTTTFLENETINKL